MMRVINHLWSASKRSKQIGIGISSQCQCPGFAASTFCVVPNRVKLYDQETFPPGSSGYMDYAPYEIFDRSKDDGLPQNVYQGTYCDLPATVHYFGRTDSLHVQKWCSIQKACNAGYVLSIKALYATFEGPMIVFTEPVKSSLAHWVTKMKVEQEPLIDRATGYITPAVRSIYRDILTSIMHVHNYTNDCHGNVTLENIWVRRGSTVLGSPICFDPLDQEDQAECVTDTDMFVHVLDIIHDDFLPKELEFFCRILHDNVAVILSLLVLSPFLKTHTEKMRDRFLAVRLFFDSTDSTSRANAVQIYKGYWNLLFANEPECAVMWHTNVTAHNPISSGKDHPVTKDPMTYAVNFIISKWMVDGHPIHFLICVRNCAEHGTHMESEEYFDLLVIEEWPAHLSMLSYLISLHHPRPFLSSFTAFTLEGASLVFQASQYPMKERREWKADKALEQE
ncbi:PREDICTED: uncharacterized protein LOC103344231 [Prunus mume]|uniref:Uncharacterized protein LOC103344231 n=1 Tax=Prunus mume TaxID=102107 RepID=A0ABM0PXF8_PRUMU|nr:PREDICTED: uncharacterized protein LOC103344231 [Prunus mume]